MQCEHFEQGRCRSCPNIQQPLAAQLLAKQQTLRGLLSPFVVGRWLDPVFGPEQGFRNKAKMVVMGAAHQPVLGVLSPQGEPVSLCDCALYPEDMQCLLHRLEQFVRQAGIPPYRIDRRRGELKYILLTRSQLAGEFMLRFVLRSGQAIERIQRELPRLLVEYPSIKVVSVNLQPVHMAILEGEQEIFLTGQTRLAERFNHVPLSIRPKSFFQTNPQVAAQLYQTAQQWLQPWSPTIVWDLFCGVGGFGLHCASAQTRLVGIEIEPEAISCALLSAKEMGLSNVSFRALASDDFADGLDTADKPDAVIVNPPRRGIGARLCQSLQAFAPPLIIYSSCNAVTLAEDLARLDDYQIVQVQLFDLFVHTDHFEVLVLLQHKHQ